MAHYFDQEPKTEHRYRLLEAEFCEVKFKFHSDSSVFSATKIDQGSQLLLLTVLEVEEMTSGSLLDLGCGYGLIAVVLRKLRPLIKITASDVNRRALELAKDNLKLNNLSSVDFIEADGLEKIGRKFDLILSNPPIRVGKKTVYRLFSESFLALNEGGRLYLVIRKKQGAASSLDELKRYCSEVEVMRKKGGYWIISCTKDSAEGE